MLRALPYSSADVPSSVFCRLQAPTRSGLLEGRWRLLYTSRPGTASPIQQTFVSVDAFTVYQEILSTDSGIRINNIVSFGPTIGQLKVSAPSLAPMQISFAGVPWICGSDDMMRDDLEC